MKKQRTKSVNWILGLILILALFLYSWKIWDAGYSNDFYTAAIKSMTQSWSNFWYASFDPAGYITVDKPPVALWFMALSAKIFGVHGWSVVLPSIIFGVTSVALIYYLIASYFGKIPGYLAALALTFTPIVVAVSRTNNLDATLIFFLLLAIFFLEKSVQTHHLSWLCLSFATIGVAFNVKMLQAFMVLPSMYFFYWLAGPDKWQARIKNLSIATIFLLVFTLFWPLTVEMIPAKSRPYIGGSGNNSVLNLAFGYNGTERLFGQSTGMGARFQGINLGKSKRNFIDENNGNSLGKLNHLPPGKEKNKNQPPKPPQGNLAVKNFPGSKMQRPQGRPNGKQRRRVNIGGAFNIGKRGPLRIFQSALGPQISWLLPIALFGGVAALLVEANPKRRWYQLTKRQKQVALWFAWLIPVSVFFSIANFFHPYYMIMLAPPIAALFGLGLPALGKLFQKNNFHHWKSYLLLGAIALTIGLQAWYLSFYYQWLVAALLMLGILLLILLVTNQNSPSLKNIIGLTTLVLLLSPAWWSLTPTLSGASDAIPNASPELLSSNHVKNGGLGHDTVNNRLLTYLNKNQGNAKYLFATSDSGTAAPYIIKTGKAVMALGGFNGTDQVLTLKEFQSLVKRGEIKYYYLSQRSANQQITQWIVKNGKKISINDDKINEQNLSHNPPAPNDHESNGILYDLSKIYHER